MKKLILLSLTIFLLSSCYSEQEEVTFNSEAYDQEFSMRLGDKVSFSDGNAFEVKVITDQFCCCLCHCSYQGGLEILIETENADGEKDLVHLGSGDLNRSNEVFDKYVVSKIDYLYNGEADSLPLCPPAEIDPDLVELFFIVSIK